MIRIVMLLLVVISGAAEAKTMIYVSNAEDGTIGVYSLDRQKGVLTPQTAIEAGAKIMPLAVSPDRRFLYAGLRSEPFRVVTFAIGRDGALAKQSETALPDNMAYLSTDKSGSWLFAASYYGDKISLSPIGADGKVAEAKQILATGRNAHCILADSSNRFVFATNLGADQILQYRFDAARGQLDPNDPPLIKTEAGEGPRHMVFSPDGRFLYVLTELRGEVLQYAIDPQQGTLTRIASASIFPASTAPAKIWAADLKITPDGRFLYASERSTSRISEFALEAGNGAPRLLGTTATETQPRGIAISPSGDFLMASGEKSEQLSLYRINRDGTLAAPARALGGKGANWVEIIDLP